MSVTNAASTKDIMNHSVDLDVPLNVDSEQTPVALATAHALSDLTQIVEAHTESDLGTAKEPARSLGYYRTRVRKHLDAKVFELYPMRLAWYATCAGVSLALFFTVVHFSLPWPVQLAAGLCIGFCNGLLGLISHEIAHGSVVRSQRFQRVLGLFGTLPFLISPTFWKYSHNRLHHSKTQKLIEDPDAYPTHRIFKSSKFMKAMFPFTPGSGYKRSYSYFFVWLSIHYIASQTYLRFRNRIYNGMDHRAVTLEFSFQVACLIGLLIYAGPANWICLALVPLMVQNYLVMSYIATNHNLNPLTSENDPLMNSLTVSNHPWLEFFHVNFGYHVEHHLFPTINGRHIKAVHHELARQFPSEYKIMTKGQAMKALYKTARIYKNSRELVHPESGQRFPTI